MGGDGGCRVSEVRAGPTSPMPDHKGFKLQYLVNFQNFSTLRVNSYDTVFDPLCPFVDSMTMKFYGLNFLYSVVGNFQEVDTML